LPFEEIVIWSLEDNKFKFFREEAIPGSIAKALGFSNGKAISVKTLAPQKLENLVYSVLGYYTSEGDCHQNEYGRNKRGGSLRFSFGIHEKNLHDDCIKLMCKVFNLEPHFHKTKNNALEIEYYSMPIAQWFAKQCGQGAPTINMFRNSFGICRENIF
jgi:hypothetical protein